MMRGCINHRNPIRGRLSRRRTPHRTQAVIDGMIDHSIEIKNSLLLRAQVETACRTGSHIGARCNLLRNYTLHQYL